MIDFQEIIDNFQDFLLENKKKTIIICGFLIFMTFSAVIVLCVNETSASGKKNKKIDEQKLVLDQELLVPPGPVVPEGYITTRKTEKNWSEEEIEKWFTLPDETEVEQLSQANDRIVQEIIGAAP